MKLDSLQELFWEELRDIYDAEQQLVKALPKMAKAAETDQLISAFRRRLEQTGEHFRRLERVFQIVRAEPEAKTCKGMKGLIAEGSEIMKTRDADPATMDAGLISAAQRVEHYEIAAYGTVASHAEALGEDEAAGLLRKTLEEAKETDKLLTRIAETTVNQEATA